MSVEDTRKKLIDIIIKHYFDGGKGNLTIKAFAGQAGISRQAIYRFYGDLVPYATGERPVEELTKDGTGDVGSLLAKAQARISDLQRQLEQLRAMWHGERIAVLTTDDAPAAGVDTPEDLERVRAAWGQLLAQDGP